MNGAYDIAGLRRRIGAIRTEDNPVLVKQKSRDFYWYSPVLKRELDAVTADIVVSPTTEAEVAEVLAAAYELGNSEFIGRRENLRYFGFGRRRDHDIGRDRVEFALQNRRIPVEVATLLLDQNRVVLGSDGADTAAQPGDVVSAIHLPKPSSASSSE